MPELVLGPMLRYVDGDSATIWVQTDGPCEVDVLGHRARTFQVSGHHYAVVIVEGLSAGDPVPYTVALDGEVCWPLPGAPPSTIAVLAPGGPLRIAFGSCRVVAPHGEPFTRERRDDPQGRGRDALRAFAAGIDAEPGARPALLLMVGDQVYADDSAPETRAFIRARRPVAEEPGDEVADFAEYAQLYREAWSDPEIRRLFATVPSAMIFDDHEVVDDWNSSESWRREMEARPWWIERIVGALSAYWIYQHLGNLSPAELRADPLYAAVTAAPDGAGVLREFALRADRGGAGARWSYSRRLGNARLVVVDSRAGRVLEPGRREMLDDEQWRWLDGELRGDVDHLLLATSLPYLLPASIHAAESWSEAIGNGAWGARVAGLAERLRRTIDLEHWAAFRDSFARVAGLLDEVASGARGRAPATIVLLSGDVHFGYLAQARFAGAAGGARSAVFQAVASPFRQGLTKPMQLANRLAFSRVSAWLGVALLWSAGLRRPPIRWRIRRGPVFANQVATLELSGRAARLRLDQIAGRRPALHTAFAAQLSSGE